MKKNQRIKTKGFTITELTAVLGIIAFISIMSAPLFVNYQKNTKLKSEARILATNLRLTQQLAITEQKIYQLKLYPLTNSYQIVNAETSNIFKEVNFDSEVSVNQISGLTDNSVSFNPTGGVAETGSITLTNTRSQISTLDIKPSGYVEVID